VGVFSLRYYLSTPACINGFQKTGGGQVFPRSQNRIEWEQDENGYCDMLGEGGICQDIANAMANVLMDNGIECSTVSQQSGEQHVYVVAKTEDGVYNVDISPYLYETGGGYCWKKIPDVEFDKTYVVIDRLSSDPNEFDDYVGDF